MWHARNSKLKYHWSAHWNESIFGICGVAVPGSLPPVSELDSRNKCKRCMYMLELAKRRAHVVRN